MLKNMVGLIIKDSWCVLKTDTSAIFLLWQRAKWTACLHAWMKIIILMFDETLLKQIYYYT